MIGHKSEVPRSLDDLAPWPTGALVDAVRRAGGPVLDFGCGRGDFVLRCRAEGIEAYGIEPNLAYLEASARLAAELGWADALRPSMAGFRSGTFALVVSNQVLEHVADIDAAAADLARVTAPGGAGYHVFPARWRPWEDHLRMPPVHWLPAGARRHAIRACAAAGFGPGWADGDPDALWRYSVEKTHYRTIRRLRRAFGAVGLDARPAHREVAGERVRRWFVTVHLATTATGQPRRRTRRP